MKKTDKTENQIDRIKSKLKKARRKDKDLTDFGSDLHKYVLNKRISKEALAKLEQENQVKLPEHFALFLTEVGNGGAGPYYGIYEIDKSLSYTGNTMALDCVLYPRMPKEEWNLLAGPFASAERFTDEEYDAARDKITGGMLNFGTQGCSYDMYIVIQGAYSGKVVYAADIYADTPFFFTYEDNFLDWYERWLDEIILGYDTAWFGYKMPGGESELIQTYEGAQSAETKTDALEGMFKLDKISQEAICFLKSIAEDKKDRNNAIRLICKYSFDDGRPYIAEMIKSEEEEDVLETLKTLRGYGKGSDIQEFVNAIHGCLGMIEDHETLSFAGYILESFGTLTLKDIEPFLCHPNPLMRRSAIYATRGCSDKAENAEIIAKTLTDCDEEVVRDSILYYGVVPHEELLPYYKAIWLKFKDNENFAKNFHGCLKKLKLPEDYFDK